MVRHLFQPRFRWKRLKRTLMALDSRLDASTHALWNLLARGWQRLRDSSDAVRVHGFKRLGVEFACEGLTWGAAGAVVMLALAKPAFEASAQDWRARADLAVTFLDRNGMEIGKRGILQTDAVPLNQLPDHLIKAAMAIEDRRFYSHFGIDIPGTLRAIVANARQAQVVQGGSSFSQQLAKNLFLTNERTLERKVKEAFLALWLESRLTKDEILKLYLDRAYMGGGTFGVEAASQFYFGKSARDLTLAEAAMLSGLFKAPSKFAPHVNLPAARARANVVLDTMVAAGFMTAGQVHSARINPATPVSRMQTSSPDFYLDWAYDEIKKLVDAGALAGQRTLVVRTALDKTVQNQADISVENALRSQGQHYDVRQSAVVIMDPQGGVRAMVGGRDYGTSQFNRAVDALRQPGSSFKPFVYTTAMMNGYTPTSIVTDGPITIGNWSPQNYGRSYAGPVTLTTALTKSLNTVPVRLAQAIGRDKIVEVAKNMGIRSELKITRALPLGPAEVTVLDMTSAYAVFANGGFKADPYAAMEVRNTRGDVLWQRARDVPEAERVLMPQVVANMNTMLLSVVMNGTGRRAQLEHFPVGGKTGTTQDYRDAWFVGFSGDFAGGVWFGNDDYSSTNKMTGGTLPASVWHDIMVVAHQGIPPTPLPGLASATYDNRDKPAPAALVDIARPGRLSRKTSGILLDIEAMMKKAMGSPISDAGSSGTAVTSAFIESLPVTRVPR
jgi:penicillin-binding protein 1A